MISSSIPCLDVEVVCGPRVLVVVHRSRKDHGKDLKFSQPMLEGKKKKTEEGGRVRDEQRGTDKEIEGELRKRGKGIRHKRKQSGKVREIDRKGEKESNEHRKRKQTKISQEK